MSKITNLITEWGRIGDADRPALGEWLIDHEDVTVKDRLRIPRDLEDRDFTLKVIKALLLTTKVVFLGENREDYDTLCVELAAFTPGCIWYEVSQDGYCQLVARREDGSCAGPFPFIDVKDPDPLGGVFPRDVGAILYVGADADDYPLAHDIESQNEGAQVMYIRPLSDMITVNESSCAMKRDLTEYFTDERCQALMESMVSGDGLLPESPIVTDAYKTIELDLDDDDIFSVVECDPGMDDDAFTSFMDDIESVVYAGADVEYVPGSYQLDYSTLTFRHPNGTHYTLSPSADGVLVEPEPPAGPDPLLNSRIQDYLRHSAWAELGLLAGPPGVLVQRKTLGIIEVHIPVPGAPGLASLKVERSYCDGQLTFEVEPQGADVHGNAYFNNLAPAIHTVHLPDPPHGYSIYTSGFETKVCRGVLSIWWRIGIRRSPV